MPYRFKNNCVNTPERQVPLLNEMIWNAQHITRKTFLKHTDKEEIAEIAECLGYSRHPKQGLTMAGDWHISYHRSKWGKKRCYFFKWSGIEYYFTKG